MEQEFLVRLLRSQVLAEDKVGCDKCTDDNEEQRVVEFLINHIEAVVGANARQEEIVSVS